MCVLIYDMGFPSSQRHYFQPLWTMWNRLNIHTHPWAQRVRPISNCHRTFIFIPHPERNIQWFLSQMWSTLTKHIEIFSSSLFLFYSSSGRFTCGKSSYTRTCIKLVCTRCFSQYKANNSRKNCWKIRKGNNSITIHAVLTWCPVDENNMVVHSRSHKL